MNLISSKILATLALCASSVPVFAAITPEQAAQLPPAVKRPVNFSKEIKPIFEASCIKCHGRGRVKGGFRLDTRETLLKGGDSGPAIVPGKSAESLLIALVQGLEPENVMPQKGSKLTPDQIGVLRGWIDQGALWEAGITFGRLEPINLKPHMPEVPHGSEKANPIDRFLEPYYAGHKIKPPQPVADHLFARRAYLDIIGLLPPPTNGSGWWVGCWRTTGTTPNTGSRSGTICSATITRAPATLTAGASKSPNGSIRRCSRTCPTASSSPNSSILT